MSLENMKLLFVAFCLGAFSCVLTASENRDAYFQKQFKDKEGCFFIQDIDSGESIYQYNQKRCTSRYVPCSTFKIALVAMAFDSGYFKRTDQLIKWDGKKRFRKEVNQDQTPRSFIQNSVIWVSRLIVQYLGKAKVQSYLNNFDYGNKEVSGKLKSFWLSEGSIKISPKEQTKFLSRLWRGHLKLKGSALEKVKKVTLFEEKNDSKVYGKTGTGCIDKGCIRKPGRQLGWFVGVLEKNKRRYAFALNYSDRIPSTGYAGPKAKKIATNFLRDYFVNVSLPGTK